MIIPVLPSLANREQWIAFCRRERPYCFVSEPDTLVDMQSSFLTLTLLNRSVRDGRQATKYSIGSRTSLEPAWQFIKACHFDLQFMVDGLQQVNFDGNARDSGNFRPAANVRIRKFFAKEAAVISPALLGTLEPLQAIPAVWTLTELCQILANEQYQQLRLTLPQLGQATPSPGRERLLHQLINDPHGWQLSYDGEQLSLGRDGTLLLQLQPDLRLTELRRDLII
ncbi:hypothetical protein [Motiliproteus sediminis]|uniref:hypothetical protein n=1 Tax=Motiliproteus sediminis TaxID=1468178 RepID=UPI001AEF91E8|nr:hypothetical protein [Motiliproteus sediminis]